MRIPRLLIVGFVVLIYGQVVMSGYQPIRSPTLAVAFNETGSGKAFPDYTSNSAVCSQQNGNSYFGNELNFAAVPNMIITGAADQVYLFNQELECQHSYPWNTTTGNFMACIQAGIENSACRNHIRVYKKIPSQPSVLLVCGTQGGISPQCGTLNVSNNIFAPTSSTFRTVPASDSLISSYPEFNWFGEFIESSGTPSSPDRFFSSGYYRGNRQLGRVLNISYHSVTYSPSSAGLTLNRDFSAKDDIYWLNLPVTLVDYYRADYGVSSLYQFYFVFLREVLVGISGLEIIYSRVARICRNDPGINGHFSTYMKARIFCEREVPPGRQFNGAVDYHYNEIRSLVFNDEGRIGEGGTWVKMMYGAFSGPTIGPPGTAICAYRADDSSTTGGTGFNRGIFDIFREDLIEVMPNGMTAERENDFVECGSTGRTTNFNNVLTVQDVSQIGEDPLVVFDGLIVTQMALDQVCVVTASNPRQCQNQDVLFLGTDTGKILKVVFSGSTTYDPVIAEEITLDPNSDDAVKELRIEGGSTLSQRYIYVVTESRVYRLPLQRCSRLQGCNECIESRDPYCVWNNSTNQVGCQENPLTASGSNTASVPTQLWQNIHTGSVPECLAAPSCDVTVVAISDSVVTCRADCNNTISITFSSTVPGDNNLQTCGGQPTSPSIGASAGCVQFSGSIGLHSYTCTVEARPSSGSPVVFTDTTVTPPGPPLCINEQDVIHFPGQRDLTICVNLEQLTDHFQNYGYEVILNGNSRRQNFTDDNCLKFENLTPGSTQMYSVTVYNSISSSCVPVSVPVQLLEDKPGQVENLQVTASNVSVTVMWGPPGVTNGNVNGYTVSLGESVVISCAVLNSSFMSHTINGLIPYSEYTVDVKACTTAGEGISNSMTFQTLCGSPSGVRGLSVTAGQSFHMLNVSWNPPVVLNGDPNSIKYRINYSCYLPNTTVHSSSGMTETTSFIIDEREALSPLTDCCVRVYAETMCNSLMHPGEIVSACGRTSDTTPLPVRNLLALSVSDHSLFASWEPPINYARPGLQYALTFDGQSTIVTGRTYYFINTLTPSTTYTVGVRAVSTAGMSELSQATNDTKPPQPSPPTNVRFSTQNTNDIMLEWTPASDVTQYTVLWRCNELSGNTTTSGTIVNVIPYNTLDDAYTWCTARVQSINEVGISDLSDAASTIIPQLPPSQPTCYPVDNRGSSADFSFTVTDPFSLNQVQVEWILNIGATIASQDTLPFVNSTLTVPVMRNTNYIFRLRLCNLHGCSDYCPPITFTTNTNPPQAPLNLNATNITAVSAAISWDPPTNENPESLLYTFEVTSSCINGNVQRQRYSGRTFQLTNLCSGKLYSFVVQATDTMNNVTGPLSRPYTFQIPEGIPSKPRDVQLELFFTLKMLTVHWAEPLTTNGNLTSYEVLWSITNINNCEEVYKLCTNSERSALCGTTNTTSSKMNATFNADTADSKTIVACVRAYTSAGVSEWGSFYNGTVQTGGLTSGGEDECNGLITVAVIASCAVVSSITMGIILLVVIWKTKSDEKFNKQLPPGYDRTASIQSTRSTKSLISRSDGQL